MKQPSIQVTVDNSIDEISANLSVSDNSQMRSMKNQTKATQEDSVFSKKSLSNAMFHDPSVANMIKSKANNHYDKNLKK